MSAEAHLIAARLASSPWFPLPSSDSRDGRTLPDATVHVEVEGDVVTVTVTDRDGAKREYRAQVQLVSSLRPADGNANPMRTAPVVPGVRAPGGSRCNPTITRK